MINFIFSFPIESVGLCSINNETDGRSLFTITFGSNLAQYSSETPSSFGFDTSHRQKFAPPIDEGMFSFLNLIPGRKMNEVFDIWLEGKKNNEWDHTENDNGGYMYLVNVAGRNSKLFRSSVNYLCVGLRYEFSAYLANVLVKQRNNKWLYPSNIRFEIRDAINENQLVAQFSTGDIPIFEGLTWLKYGLSFNASSTSAVLLMISNAGGGDGNDIAIDDIELRVCLPNDCGFCPPGQCIYYYLNVK